MVSGDELYSASDIFAMLEESNEPETNSGSCSVDNSGGGGGGEPQCDINGYCKSDTCLGLSSIEGDAGGSLDSYYSTVEGMIVVIVQWMVEKMNIKSKNRLHLTVIMKE